MNKECCSPAIRDALHVSPECGESDIVRKLALLEASAAKHKRDLAALREALQAALASLESFTAHIETCDLQPSDMEAICTARKALADTERRPA